MVQKLDTIRTSDGTQAIEGIASAEACLEECNANDKCYSFSYLKDKKKCRLSAAATQTGASEYAKYDLYVSSAACAVASKSDGGKSWSSIDDAGECEVKKTTTTSTTTTVKQATITGVAKAALTGVYVGVTAAVVLAVGSAAMVWHRRRGHEQLADFAPPKHGGDYSAHENLLTEYTFNGH